MPKGLSALIPQNQKKPAPQSMLAAIDPHAPASREKIWQIPLSQLTSNVQQPRVFFDPRKMEELVTSLRTYGVLQPLIVTPRKEGGYEIVAGERRFRAAKELGLRTIPAIVRETKDLEKLELALIENIQREDLDPIERASAYRKLMDEFGLTQEEAAKRLGKPRSVIANTVRILELPSEIQRAVARGEISEGHAKVLAGLPESGSQFAVYRRIVAHDLSVRETEALMKNLPATRGRSKKMRTQALSEEVQLLEEALATRVEIHRHGKKGRIIVHFSDWEELRRLVRRILQGS